jgi:hypothetical protein
MIVWSILMHDLSDVTFTIPVKIDQPDRVRNIKICIEFLRKNNYIDLSYYCKFKKK